jgi:hypothetical protein
MDGKTTAPKLIKTFLLMLRLSSFSLVDLQHTCEKAATVLSRSNIIGTSVKPVVWWRRFDLFFPQLFTSFRPNDLACISVFVGNAFRRISATVAIEAALWEMVALVIDIISCRATDQSRPTDGNVVMG